jgi:hypothetical protein
VRPIAFALLVLFLAAPAAQDWPLPDYETFAAQVKMHLATDEERQNGYMFLERRTEQKLDGVGRAKDESVKVFEVYPGLPGEDRYRRLIEGDGKPVPQGQLALHDRERQKQVESYAKGVSTSAERQRETRQREKERRQYSAAIDDLFRSYDIHMVRRESIEGHDMIVATLTPKDGVKPQTDDGKIMRHFKAPLDQRIGLRVGPRRNRSDRRSLVRIGATGSGAQGHDRHLSAPQSE